MAEQQVQPLHNEKHANTKIKNGINVEFMKTQHLVPVVAHEFARIANEFPMSFVKNNETGTFSSSCYVSPRARRKLGFVESDKWTAAFAPMATMRYPLGFSKYSQIKIRYGIVIDEASPLVGEEEANVLFENGEETDYLKRRKEALVSFIEFSQITDAFTKFLADKELLVAQTLTVDIKGEKKDINGIYLIDEKKLNELSDADFLELRKRGYLAPIYSFLMLRIK